MDDMECPVPSHRNRAEAGEDCGVGADIDEAHTRIVSLRDANLASGENAVEPEPGAAAKPAELVEGVDPVKGNESSAKRPIRVTSLSPFELRAAEADRREGEWR